MGFLTLADQLKNRIDPRDTTAAGAKAASGYQPGEYAGLPRVMPQTAPVQYDSPPPQQDVSQYSPEVIAPPSMRGMQIPGEQSNIGPAPLPQDYQRQQDALFQPGPLQQRYSQAALNGPGEAPHGFLGHLKGALQGFGQGGVLGAGIGLAAPGIPQRAAFYNQTLPLLAQQADQEMQQQGQQRQGYHALAQSTGYDPITHQPTLPMLTQQSLLQHRNILENQGQERIDNTKNWHDQTIQARKDTNTQRFGHYATQDLLKLWSGGGMNGNPDMLRHLADRLGVPDEIDDKFIPSAIKQVIDESGQFVDHNTQTGKNTATGIKSGTFEQREHATNARLRISQAHLTLAQQREWRLANGSDAGSVAFDELHKAGKIDANGMADNPKYLADVERRMAGARWFHTDTSGNVDEEAARKDAEASAAIKFKPKVAVTELEDFKGLKASIKARGKAGQASPNRSSQRQSAVDEYNRRKAAKPEKAEAMREAFKQQMGFDPEQP